jgi:alcohol dehydrogenase class IV
VNPILDTMAAEGIRVLAGALRGVRADGADMAARAACLYGAYLSAVTFAGASSGLHHTICHVLGGAYDLPHADTHAVVLPHVWAFNADDAPSAVARVASALDSADAVGGLAALQAELGAPHALRDLGMPQGGVDEAAGLVADAVPPDNPRLVTSDAMARLLRRAWAGDAPLTASQEAGR